MRAKRNLQELFEAWLNCLVEGDGSVQKRVAGLPDPRSWSRCHHAGIAKG